MHVNDPMRRYYRFFFVCEGIVLISFIFQAIISTLARRPNYFFYGYSIFFFILLVFLFFAFKRRHQRTDVRRQRALQGDPAFLAQPQPAPDAYALATPTKISLHLSKTYFLEFLGIFYIITALATVGFVTFFLSPSKNTGGTPVFIGIVLIALFGIFLFSFIISLLITGPFIEQEITVDEYGITTKFYRQYTRMPWNEVQTFAIWGNAKRFSLIQFEITNQRDVARWYQLGSQRKLLTWFSMLKPNMPRDEYHDKMIRLQQVIVARTGKPLYDLRDEKIVWW